MRSRQVTRAVLGFGLLLLVLGCQNEEIRRYTVPRLEKRPAGMQYSVPEGWIEAARAAMSAATFQIADGSQTAQVTVTPLAGAAGGLLENVNRWRKQVGLGPIAEEQLRQEIQKLDVAGVSSQYVDLIGPESPSPERRRILGAVVPRGETTWFFKMMGAPDLVAKQKPAFEAFLRSIRFEEGVGAKNG